MKPEMEDVELAQLELRLRNAVVGHRPAAPESLVSFIDTVPAMEPAGRRMGFAGVRPGVRWAFFALAAAAVLVVGVAGAAALVKVRSDQSTGVTGAGDGWTWQQADGTLVTSVFRVAEGFVGLCTDTSSTQSVCTSADGSTWTAPPDPAILTVDGNDWFWPWHIVRSGDVYVSDGEAQSCPTGICHPSVPAPAASDVGNVLWRSTDGVHWSRVDSPAFSGLYGLQVGLISGGFVAVGVSSDASGTGADWALTSTDGLTWTRASQLPVKPGSAAGEYGAVPPAMVMLEGNQSSQPSLWAPGSVGVSVANGSASDPLEWRSLDGKTWAQVHVPSGMAFAIGGRTSDGSYLGAAFPAPSAVVGGQIVRSADGLTWHVDQGNLEGTISGLSYVGGRLVASVSESPASLDSAAATATATPAPAVATPLIWESLDLGHTWRPLLDATGRQMNGGVGQIGDRLVVYSASSGLPGPRLVLLGSLGGPVPTPTPPKSYLPTPSPTPMASPSGGISRADAIRIAANAVSATPAEIDGATAELVFGDPVMDLANGRWAWEVTFTPVAGSSSGQPTIVMVVMVDYLTGDVIDAGPWTTVGPT